jgi:phage gpG-like protein
MAKQLVLKGGNEGGRIVGLFLGQIFREFSAQAESKSEKALLRAALQVENTSKLLMRNRTDVSEDGLPPRVDTGRLRASITHRLIKENDTKMIAEVGTNVEYATDLEYGTSKRFKHPFLTPALDKNIQAIVDMERDAIREAANAARS